ncbi:uncharacterized protein LOC129615828 [Condylostylus longicornis]|uniref:uncharacterized protein LOC129615828 n=1 Tax=Condylostylus longicornis TaxID=2530218 RepID=UPI00244E33D3|nr:uncharacterized protein LOC129615828 [Condylostylus longicornis]
MITYAKIIYSIFGAFVLLVLAIKTGYACRISEFPCRGSSLCIPLDKYCDGRDDCGDLSDEPKGCTVCNRTYYGDVARTYSLKVPKPQWNRLPFLCHLTFTASGHEQGDIVQIIFDGFTVGRFDEGMVDPDADGIDSSFSSIGELPGCPEGFMQLSELGRPFTGGSWCGKASGPQLYFSETSTVTASVKVFHPPSQPDDNSFEFRIRYKFISQSDALVRYGSSDKVLELGRVTPGTYCTRQFDECYRKNCRLQSPNYPGMYPRNVTCYWTIRQKEVPTCKHAMIAVSQENQHKSLVKRSIASFNKTSRSIRAWSDCTGERDHLIFYDGSSTNDPVLAKYCGGDWLPKVVSRGSEMLVAFHSSPFSAPLQSGIPNRGFELDVDILFADSDSYDFSKGPNKYICEFHINASNPDDVLFSRRGRMGRIVSPRHTLPPNTSCTYYFHGYPGDLIWLSFTSYSLQILQQAIHDNNTLGRADLPPWITRLRMWDSHGTYVPMKITTTTLSPAGNSGSSTGRGSLYNQQQQQQQQQHIFNNTHFGPYYYSPLNPKYGKNIRVNIDNAWNPVDTYIYGPTQPSIFNQENKYGGYLQQKFIGNGIAGVKESFNFIATGKFDKSSKESSESKIGLSSGNISGKNKRRLMLEIYDYETPKLCDHTAITTLTGHNLRPCSPLESYVSSGRDLKIEFHTHTGTALYPAQFSLNYEFVDTEMGGDFWPGRRGEDPVPPLCTRLFKKRKGNVQSPRNVFLYGRGGAKNLTCLYRFEAGVSERIKLTLHNVSFGESTSCITDSDLHTGRPRCTNQEIGQDARISELKLYDVPFRDVKIPLGCLCDNTSALYNAPLTFISNSRTMELTFTVTRLNISEDFADVYFYASYEFKRVTECRKKLKLKGNGGEDEIKYPLKSQDSSCEGSAWYIEVQQPDRSLFIQTWGSYLPNDPTSEDAMRCHTKNRLMIYSGRPLKITRVICPSQPGPRPSSLQIFSEDWVNGQSIFTNKPVSLILEPIFKEPGEIHFKWLEIQHTRSSFLQQLDLQANFTAINDTLTEFGLFPRESDCEYKCPEIDACISGNLWCDGIPNCPSGFDESEEECGTARKLLELSGGIFAALGCIAAAITACILFCIFGLMRKRKKSVNQKTVLNGTMKKDTFKKDPLYIDPAS